MDLDDYSSLGNDESSIRYPGNVLSFHGRIANPQYCHSCDVNPEGPKYLKKRQQIDDYYVTLVPEIFTTVVI